jgi:hypothetical protein
VCIGYSHEWPGVVVTMSNGGKPCCFGRETCCSMEILDGLFDDGELIDIEDGMVFSFHRCLEVVADSFCGWHMYIVLRDFVPHGESRMSVPTLSLQVMLRSGTCQSPVLGHLYPWRMAVASMCILSE